MNHLKRTLSRLSLISFLVSCIIWTACSEKEVEQKSPVREDIILTEEDLVFDYKYAKDLQVYLKDNIKEEVSFSAVDTLLFIPLNSCSGCVEYTLMATAINNFTGKVVIGGIPEDFEVFKSYVDELDGKIDDVYYDSNFAMYEYVIEVGGPTMLLKKANDWRIIELSIANWPLIVEIIGWKVPDYDFSKKH